MRTARPPEANTALVKALLDVGVFSLAAVFAYWLRLEGGIERYVRDIAYYVLLTLPIRYIALNRFQTYRHIWQYVTFEDLAALGRMVAIVTGLLLLLTAFLRSLIFVPWTVPLIEGLLALAGLSGLRFLTRLALDRRKRKAATPATTSVLIAGAGDAGRMIATELLRRPIGLNPVGFLDDDLRKKGRRLLGLPVLGSAGQLPELQQKAQADLLIVAMPSADGHAVRRYVEAAQASGMQTRIIPGFSELVGGQITANQLREVRVEDLLRRPPVELDTASIHSYLEGQTVLITGAGGSIGSELVRQVVKYRPRRVILLGRGENSIFSIEQEIRRDWPEIDLVALIANVRSAGRLDQIFRTYRPNVVFHAAAHKHVPLMEASPSEAILNNVFGTRNVVECCLRYDVQRLVNVSTDKAVNPTSVMGASKRVAERVVSSGAVRAHPGQGFMSVRFGNVLGSRGSVVPTFLAQIRAGGPITITHPEMTRYFMTIPEASALVLQAGALGHNGAVHLLNMGEPVRIVDLARDVIRLSGGKDVEIVYSGIRPGEKMYEELLTNGEGVSATQHAEIFTARPEQPDPHDLNELLIALERAAKAEDGVAIRQTLHAAITGSHLARA
ncbi:polysaccharide biosynthesis protein [Deinococcus hopiensis]|uniref:NDP-sugar epimerase, includes UDP-GlcNAc-inverting 4,6-dehydratase FlaA1 and capsular polysaccharide biosynthesis protein EpsC n=1 Tax=Deinococcus hopiensis KR-140 TaxID=695939 RepID=A0A1W1UH71_9DEIO|nr:nucleoside-diphosphate sugar epimerase/dehydratase [Deinococcus hopiensis]SMB80410.1 NDP-sugar epimerase, includes UDP-GlcNAc-inverting 4,6-dehydratase FlaA1 and capsular polysaccharide biosynthesis protein EpsC [Deinococcus hopiensis KR-140]